MNSNTSMGRTRRGLRLAAVAASCIAIGGAQAAWQVNDSNSQKILSRIESNIGRGDVNAKLDDIYKAHEFDKSTSSGKLEPEPSGDGKLDHGSVSPVVITAQERCPAEKASGLASKQSQICAELLKTETARYLYSLKMYALTKTRHERLAELEKQRSGLQSHEYGKLQANSNELLALMALMQLDRQQHAAYIAAYDARIHYLTMAQETLTRQALEGSRQNGGSPGGGAPGSGGGSGPGGGAGGSFAAGGALVAALKAAQSRRRHEPDSRQ